MVMKVFEAGKGINANKINENFAELQSISNANETAINNVADTALRKDGRNVTQSLINKFKQETPNILSRSGTISLTDNSTNFLTLTGNGIISLPNVGDDQYSHTILLTVDGSDYSLDLSQATGGRHLYNPLSVDTTKMYNIMFVYNKIDKHWYFSLTQ